MKKKIYLFFCATQPLFANSIKIIISSERVSRYRAAGINERLDLSFSWRASEDPFRRPYWGMIRVQRSTVSQRECRS